jgi:hypothetical protein
MAYKIKTHLADFLLVGYFNHRANTYNGYLDFDLGRSILA